MRRGSRHGKQDLGGGRGRVSRRLTRGDDDRVMADVFQPNYDAARTLPRSVTLVTSRNLICRPDEAGMPLSWLPPLAALKGAGAAGFLLGPLGVRYLGIAAAAGLVLFFTGASPRASAPATSITSRTRQPT